MTDEPRRFTKQVSIVAKDDEARTATGAVLVPNEVDHQSDFLRPDGIEALHSDDVQDGVMHAAFPDAAADLVRSEVIDSAEAIGDEEFPAGTWVATRKYHDDELYGLVRDGVLAGFSIGGEVTETDTYARADLPSDVRVPDEVEPDATVTEIQDGEVTEISDVDVPAVPRADHQTVKALDKSVLDEVAGKEEFLALMADRGHDEADAERLWDYLQAQKSMTDNTDTTDGDADAPDDATKWRQFKAWLLGAPNDGTDDVTVPEVPAETAAKALEVAKQGRSLNSENREALMAAHDAIESALASDVDFRQNRFTDDPFTDFDVSEFGKAADADAVPTDKDAPSGETGDDSMSSDDSETEKSLPEQNAERLDSIEEKLDKAVDAEDAETADEAEKSRPAWADDLVDKVEANAEAIEQIGKQSGASQQLGDVADAAKSGEESVEEAKKRIFLPPSARGD